MDPKTGRSWRRTAWERARAQHWVISRAQLVSFGAHSDAIVHRLNSGRLHRLFRGVYSVGRPDPGRLGWFMAAALAAGSSAFVSHRSAASLWTPSVHSHSVPIHVSVPGTGGVRRRGRLTVHRRAPELLAARHVRSYRGIPVTGPGETIIDIAPGLDIERLDATVAEADKLDLIDPVKHQPGHVVEVLAAVAARLRSSR